jgi:hypothetical protein
VQVAREVSEGNLQSFNQLDLRFLVVNHLDKIYAFAATDKSKCWTANPTLTDGTGTVP